MNINKILSKENQNLDLVADRFKNTYQNAIPFPSIVLENFFDKKLFFKQNKSVFKTKGY